MKQEATGPRRLAPGNRFHIVLVPGFAGFDALGQLEYYAGVTPLFRRWQSGRNRRSHTVLHYFDNFPTAGVTTRAERLRRFLTKRIARGEFQPGDSVALVGHSTGGLDIRRLLWDLASSPDLKLSVDGTADVQASELLDIIDRIVFLSVPQWGTNIAHWVRENVLGRAVVVAQLRACVAATQVPILNQIQDCISGSVSTVLNVDLLRAIEDALREAETRMGSGPTETASAHEASAQLGLWLRHMAWDFAAIDDLIPPDSGYSARASQPAGTERLSPAQFPPDMRLREIEHWSDYRIATRSYATVSPCPFRFDSGKAAPSLDLLKPWTWPDLSPRTDESAGTDITYRYCYRACAGGPFRYPESEIPVPRRWGGVRRPIELWDNDGIVNTASMLWPAGSDTVLIECDHEDITGHFERIEAGCETTDRQYRAYDLLGSASHFDRAAFAAVWNDIFDFCQSSDVAAPSFAAALTAAN